MNQNFVLADYVVFIVYFIIVAAYGYSDNHKRKRNERDAKAFFLAEGTLMDCGNSADCCSGMVYPGISQEQDLYNASVFKNKV